ncbi:MAG: pyridoxamine 5'-phosphate oxidase [Betaproteobacteria bacterium RIFCSPLOWO2_12_FULL_64_23]|nr:MAG: pyridoxamine 5'-phosphate oxidase [Betaproteobacteria bacterium RIFCSPLOWO2_12_FULL_64_23]
MRIADIRQEYMRAGLVEKDAAADPFKQFDRWFQDAVQAELPLPEAMTLATATDTGRPSARVVLLKGVDARGFVFYTNYASRKGRELAANPHAALVFAWTELERQVRIEGTIKKVSAEESDLYFASRPLGSRLGAWASPQSMVLPDRLTLAKTVAAIVLRYGKHPPRPPHWGGYRVLPEAIEFWQGRKNRLHDRLLYTKQTRDWTIERLAP